MTSGKDLIAVTITRDDWLHTLSAVNYFRKNCKPFDPFTGKDIDYDSIYDEIYRRAAPTNETVSEVQG